MKKALLKLEQQVVKMTCRKLSPLIKLLSKLCYYSIEIFFCTQKQVRTLVFWCSTTKRDLSFLQTFFLLTTIEWSSFLVVLLALAALLLARMSADDTRSDEPVVLVTGGAGYIGSHTVLRLLETKLRCFLRRCLFRPALTRALQSDDHKALMLWLSTRSSTRSASRFVASSS